MKTAPIFLIVITSLLTGYFSSCIAASPARQEQLDWRPIVENDTYSKFIEAPFTDGLVIMNVRVYNDESQLVHEESSTNGFVAFDVVDWPDGAYRVETVIVFQPQSQGNLDSPSDEEEETARRRDRFVVKDGMILADDELVLYRPDSFFRKALYGVIEFALSAILRSAYAADINATGTYSANVYWDHSKHYLSLQDMPGPEWLAQSSGYHWGLVWHLGEEGRWDAIGLNSNGSGNIGDLYFDNGKVGINTLNPLVELQINDNAPQIRFFDETDSEHMDLRYDGNTFKIEGDDEQDILILHELAPENSFVIDYLGRVAFGLGTPASDAKITISANDAAIKLQDSSPVNTVGYIRMKANSIRFQGDPSTDILKVQMSAPALSYVIDTNGDSHWGNSGMNYDNSTVRLGIGTDTPSHKLHLVQNDPRIHLQDTNPAKSGYIAVGANNLVLEGDSQQNVIQMSVDSPAHAYVVDSNGYSHWGSDGTVNGDVHVYPSLNRVAIGTNAPSWAGPASDGLNITGDVPEMHLVDSDGGFAFLQTNAGKFRIYTDAGGSRNLPMHIDLAAPSNTLVIDAAGDMHWGNNGMNYDNSTRRLGIGTTSPTNILHLEHDDPRIRLHDTSPSKDAYIALGANNLVLEGNAKQNVIQMSVDAPNYGLVIDAAGRAGMGTAAPVSSLHVQRSDGSAKILVEEASGIDAPRTLFQLKNRGNTKFGLLNTQAGVEWAFANPGTGFRISRQGSGVVEMEVFNNGNVKIAGVLTENSDVNAKTAITEINAGEVLNLIAQLPVNKWEYKDARGEAHIGPMAQDFYAAFGLGSSETGISTIDTAGVALVAIKALADENKKLRNRLEALEHQQEKIQALMSMLVKNPQTLPVLTQNNLN